MRTYQSEAVLRKLPEGQNRNARFVSNYLVRREAQGKMLKISAYGKAPKEEN
jgi:hypothetical protein